MEMPLTCAGKGIEPVLIRWVKEGGAQVPVTPMSPSDVKGGDGQVDMTLIVPESHGNQVTSLLLTYTAGNKSVTDSVLPVGEKKTFEDGATVTHTVHGLENGQTFCFEVQAKNIGGLSLASSPSQRVGTSSSSSFPWWAILLIVVGAGFVVFAVVSYKRRSTDDDDESPVASSFNEDDEDDDGDVAGAISVVVESDLQQPLMGHTYGAISPPRAQQEPVVGLSERLKSISSGLKNAET